MNKEEKIAIDMKTGDIKLNVHESVRRGRGGGGIRGKNMEFAGFVT